MKEPIDRMGSDGSSSNHHWSKNGISDCVKRIAKGTGSRIGTEVLTS